MLVSGFRFTLLSFVGCFVSHIFCLVIETVCHIRQASVEWHDRPAELDWRRNEVNTAVVIPETTCLEFR